MEIICLLSSHIYNKIKYVHLKLEFVLSLKVKSINVFHLGSKGRILRKGYGLRSIQEFSKVTCLLTLQLILPKTLVSDVDIKHVRNETLLSMSWQFTGGKCFNVLSANIRQNGKITLFVIINLYIWEKSSDVQSVIIRQLGR